MKIKKPVFIIGTGRCGSSIFYEIFSYHKNLSWLSIVCDFFPKKIWLNRIIMSTIHVFPINKLLRKVLSPVEVYNFWESYIKGFSIPCRDLLKEDVTNEIKKSISTVLPKTLTKKRNRLLIKITGWPRVGFIKEIFPDAIFIHVLRDGRAVANSLINWDDWLGWGGPQKWRWGELEDKWEKEWNKYDRSFIILAAIQWKILMDAHEKALQNLPNSDYIQIKYEDLIDDPINIFKNVTYFCQLEWNKSFEKRIKSFNLKNLNFKWKKNLTEEQQFNLNKCLESYLNKYGYE